MNLTKNDRIVIINYIINYQQELFIPLSRDTTEVLENMTDERLFHYYVAHRDLRAQQRYNNIIS